MYGGMEMDRMEEEQRRASQPNDFYDSIGYPTVKLENLLT